MAKSIIKNRRKAFQAQGGRCYYCSILMPSDTHTQKKFRKKHRLSKELTAPIKCTAEHLVARSDGGIATRENIVAACQCCNEKRHSLAKGMPPHEYKVFVQQAVKEGTWHNPAVTRLLSA